MRCKNCLQELEASAEACIHCGALVNPPPVEYFYTAPLRFLFLYITTLGIYEVYWFYKNWAAIKKAEHRRIYPFWRSIFAVFFCYSLFKHIGRAATAQGYKSALSPQLLAILYAFRVFSRASGVFWLVLGYLPLVLVQRPIRFHNAHAFADFPTKRKFTRGELILTIIGLTFWGMLLLLLLPVLPGIILRTR